MDYIKETSKVQEFVVYLGKSKVVTVDDNKLSRVYRLEKGVPCPVDNSADKLILLNWRQAQGGCGTCGRGYMSRPIWSDVTYARYRNIPLDQFRDEWSSNTP